MNVYIFEHAGIWPVGACSVVTAPDEESARLKLLDLLAPQGLADCIELAWSSGDDDKTILNGDY